MAGDFTAVVLIAAADILGVDITFLLADEAAGAVYYDHGAKQDFFQILKDNKFNYVRVPSVVEPTRAFSCEDLEHVKILAIRTKVANMGSHLAVGMQPN